VRGRRFTETPYKQKPWISNAAHPPSKYFAVASRATATESGTAKRPDESKTGCHARWVRYLPRLMPKPIARSKTRKSVSKRFKITGTGKVRRQHASRRHLLSSKSAKRKRHMAKSAEVHKTDEARIKANMPFG
jgi:large subunit ribosomal protein L35